MRKFLLFLSLIIVSAFSIRSESNVYVFIKDMYNCDITIAINGKYVGDLNGSVNKTYNIQGNSMTKRKSCFRKIEINGEGKITLTGTLLYTVPTTGNVNPYKGEITLDIEDGENYYLQLTNKGLHDMQIKEIKEKNAKKWIDKWQNLGTVQFTL